MIHQDVLEIAREHRICAYASLGPAYTAACDRAVAEAVAEAVEPIRAQSRAKLAAMEAAHQAEIAALKAEHEARPEFVAVANLKRELAVAEMLDARHLGVPAPLAPIPNE